MLIFPVTPNKQAELFEQMQQLGIKEQDLEENFVRGSGRGGQKRNKTSNTVIIKHRPTGIEVRYGRNRSQSLNRFFARRLLCEEFSRRR